MTQEQKHRERTINSLAEQQGLRVGREVLIFPAWLSSDREKDSHLTLDFLPSHSLLALSLA